MAWRVKVRLREVSVCGIGSQAQSSVSSSSGCSRGTIGGFSKASSTRMSRYLSNCEVKYTSMVTLTYGATYPTDGEIVKAHLKRFRERLRAEYYLQGGGSFFWFLEFQERGAPHIHMFTNIWVPKGWLSRAWAQATAGMAPELTSTRIEALRLGRDGTISYARKYARKACQKVIPLGFLNVGRFWGVWGARGCPILASADTRTDEPISMLSTLVGMRLGGWVAIHERGWTWFAPSERAREEYWHYLQGVSPFADQPDRHRGSSQHQTPSESQGTLRRMPVRLSYVRPWSML